MISVPETATGKANAPLCRLNVVLLASAPPVWRRLQVPGDAKLDGLHAALQVAMGRTNSHLHQFTVGEACYSDPRHSRSRCRFTSAAGVLLQVLVRDSHRTGQPD
jgi:hypothetical protein